MACRILSASSDGEEVLQSGVARLRTAAVCCLLIWCPAAAAEEGGSSAGAEATHGAATAAAASAEPAAARVEEAQPSLYYLKDKQGNLQAVPNFSFEDFEQLYRLKHQLAQGDQRPRYTVQQITASGTADAEHAELTIQFRILVREEQWLRVPLHLDQAVLREQPQYQGPGEQFLHFEGESEGYVLWIRGPAGQAQQVTMKMLLPLGHVGDDTRLKLLVPRSTTSELKLRVPLAAATAKVSEGATLLPPANSGGQTELTALGLSGDFELSWCKAGERPAEVPAMLEAVGAIAARIDSRGINEEATLSVKSYGAAFDRFRVRLPQDAVLVPGNTPVHTIVPLEQGDPAAPRQRLVEVRLAKKTSGPVEVRVAAARTCDPAQAGQWCDLAGFEVVGAGRQWGSIAVTAAGDWQVLWGPSRGIRQVDQLPEILRGTDVAAGFDYFTQPCSLTARLVAKKARINVEPEYLLLVDADQVRLEAKLKYTVRGVKTFALDVALPGWQLDEVGPENLVAVDGVATSPLGLCSIPLLQPSAGQFEVRIRAHRPIPAGSQTLSVTLPQPQATAPASAIIAVLPADNVELLPDNKAMAGLVRQQLAAPLELPPRQQEPLFYRNEGGQAVFAADLRRHPQRISVESAGHVVLDEQGARVEQNLDYLVSYEPVDHLLVEVPRGLAGASRLELFQQDQPAAAVALPESSDDPAAPVRMRIALPKPCIGACRLTARYRMALQKPAAADHTVLSVPLLTPVEGELAGNRLTITAAAGLRVEACPGAWTAVEAAAPGGVQLTAAKRATQAELTVTWESGAAAAVVERAWVQSWLSSSARQDRALFAFAGNRKEVELTMPPGVDQISVLLDGKAVAAPRAADGGMTIPLGGNAEHDGHLLELRYQFLERPPRGLVTLEMPRLGRGGWVRRLYWQLILPRDEHLLTPPEGFAGEQTWAWTGSCWGRRPLLDQAQLEHWIGAPPRAAPTGQVNEYLFSAFGDVDRCVVHTAGRSWIVLAASGAALLAGLLLIYVRRLRHPATLLSAAVLLLAAGMVYPEPAALAAQAAVLGLVLALAAAILARGLARQRPLPAEKASSVLTLGTAPLATPPPPPAGDGSTPTQNLPGVLLPSSPSPDATP
jgi:hypothetical protein